MALDIKKAILKLGDQVQETEVDPADKEVNQIFDIREGETQLQTWFVDSKDEQFGAYYIYIDRIKK